MSQAEFDQHAKDYDSAILLIGGIQIMCIGMIGEYLGRAYLKLNRKPQFVVASRTWIESI